MTKMTPEQMRELADKNDAEAEAWRGFSKSSGRIALHEESAAALRTAADQLEAVTCICGPQSVISDGPNTGCPVHGERPEPPDACYNCHGAGYHDGGDMRDDEPCHACGGTGTES